MRIVVLLLVLLFFMPAHADEGLSVPEDMASPINELKTKADAGNPIAQGKLGFAYLYDNQGVERDYSKAIYWFTKSAAQGNPEALWHLGNMYQVGWGVKQDYVEAAKLYEKSAERGNVYAANNLGVMFSLGLGVPKDNTRAYVWHRLSSFQTADEVKKYCHLTPEQIAEAERLVAEKQAIINKNAKEWRETVHPLLRHQP